MAKKPGRLISHVQGPLESERRYALTGFRHETDGNNPLLQGQACIMEHGAGGNRVMAAA